MRWRSTTSAIWNGWNESRGCVKQLPGLALAGNGYRGIGVPDCVVRERKRRPGFGGGVIDVPYAFLIAKSSGFGGYNRLPSFSPERTMLSRTCYARNSL